MWGLEATWFRGQIKYHCGRSLKYFHYKLRIIAVWVWSLLLPKDRGVKIEVFCYQKTEVLKLKPFATRDRGVTVIEFEVFCYQRQRCCSVKIETICYQEPEVLHKKKIWSHLPLSIRDISVRNLKLLSLSNRGISARGFEAVATINQRYVIPKLKPFSFRAWSHFNLKVKWKSLFCG